MNISTIETQRVDDIPLLLAIMAEMGIQQRIDEEIKPHGLWQGCSVGTMVVVWLSYILTEHDHRLEPVQAWVNKRRLLFNRLLGIELRETDFTDDRLANVLTMLARGESQSLLSRKLCQDWITLYELPTEVSRYDSTTVSVYQDADESEASILGYGHSKDHRPDLAQFKVMLSSLEMGFPLTSEVVNGKRADDGLYIPTYDEVVKTVGHTRFLAVGDSKLAAWQTRQHLAQGGSWYLCPYREPAARGEDTAGWIEEALRQPQSWQSVTQVDERTGEIKPIAQVYHFSRQQQAEDGTGWTERVLVSQSEAMQRGQLSHLERREAKLYQALEILRLPAGRGRKRYRTQAALREVVDQKLKHFGFTGLIAVSLQAEPHPDGKDRWIVADYQRREGLWQAEVDRLGWQIYLSNAPQEQYDVAQLIHLYRRQPLLERSISRLKTRNLHIRPLFLHDQQRIASLTWLLILALRILVLTEFRVRRQLKQQGEAIVGLKSGSPSVAFERPTTERLLKAFGDITWSIVTLDQTQHFHLTPLTHTQRHILDLLHLPHDIYLGLTGKHSKPLFNLRE